MKFDPQLSLHDTLKAMEGGRAEILLRNGFRYAGKVGRVEQHLVVVAEIEGKEYYDALVRIEDISAIEARARSA